MFMCVNLHFVGFHFSVINWKLKFGGEFSQFIG